MAIAVSLGGSFLSGYPDKISELSRIIEASDEHFVIVCGGGEIAREYIGFGSKLNLNEDFLHKIGIELTRVNALIICEKLGGKFSAEDPRKLKIHGKITVMGGYKPGWTTDTCAAYAALSCGAKTLFNLSKEKNVYTKDPSKYKNYKAIKSMGFPELYRLTPQKRIPGMNFIFDPLAGRICERNNITVVITNDPLDIGRYRKDMRIHGTVIESGKPPA